MNLNQLRDIYPLLKRYFEDGKGLQIQSSTINGMVWEDLPPDRHFEIYLTTTIRNKPSPYDALHDISKEMRNALKNTAMTPQGVILVENYVQRIVALAESIQRDADRNVERNDDDDDDDDENYYNE